MKMSSYYRPDIDGLRAFAVIAVILFHLDIPGIPGGFVGVDVFFVISGFLITSILLREMREKRFSLINFWERRVRRIIPAMVCMLFVTTIASYYITLYPPDFMAYGLTLSAQSLSLANMFFMRQVSYFAAPDDTIPLLHTWSLGVEEQFYVFFPLLLLGIFLVSKKYLLQALVIIGLSSFCLNVYLVTIDPHASFSIPFLPHIWGGATNLSAGFYFFPARAWELLLGALVATTNFTIKTKRGTRALASIGFVGLIFSFLFIHESDSFPGYVALVPTISTVLILIAHKKTQTFIYQFLSFPIFVWVGLISYSLYLWHWPIIVLSKQIWIEVLPQYSTVFILILTFLLSFLSYHFVETPFRNKQFLQKKSVLFGITALVLMTLFAAGVYIHKKNGLPERAPESAQEIAKAATDFNPRRNECFKNNMTKVLSGSPSCTIGAPQGNENIDFILWGDSHSDALMPAFEEIARKENLYGVFFAIGGCAPLLTRQEISDDQGCQQLKQSALSFIQEHEVAKVFFVSEWKNTYKYNDNKGSITIQEALKETLDTLPKGQKVTIVKKVPEQKDYFARETFYRHARGYDDLTEINISLAEHFNDTAETSRAIDAISSTNDKVTSIDPTDIFCDLAVCHLTKNGQILYRDRTHVNNTGALLLKKRIESSI